MRDNCGKYAGLPVSKAKVDIKNYLYKDNKADVIFETSRQAVSRDGGEVIVAILDDQWFLDFNAENWKTISSECLSELEIWPDKYRKQFEDVFAWLDKKPCAKMRGFWTSSIPIAPLFNSIKGFSMVPATRC